jgi:hypothetical protein
MRYQPQQSVLYPQAGQRQTACMRNISSRQRSHSIRSTGSDRVAAGTGVDGRDAGVEAAAGREGVMRARS